MTYYGRWTYKYEEAARQGAKGLFIVHDKEGAGYEWYVVQQVSGILPFQAYSMLISLQSKNGPHFHLKPNGYLCEIEGWWTTETAQRVFKMAGTQSNTLFS